MNIFHGISTPMPWMRKVMYTRLYLSRGMNVCSAASSMLRFLKLSWSSGRLFSSHDCSKRTGCCASSVRSSASAPRKKEQRNWRDVRKLVGWEPEPRNTRAPSSRDGRKMKKDFNTTTPTNVSLWQLSLFYVRTRKNMLTTLTCCLILACFIKKFHMQ